MEANDMKAMREALECVLDDYADDSPIAEMIRAALKNPPRNCDVGTAEEQAKRMDAYCTSYRERIGGSWRCDNCPLCSIHRCELAWAQMPYVEKEGGAK